MRNQMKPLDITYDEHDDIITIEGIKYAADIFRLLGGAFSPGILVKFQRDELGVLIAKNMGETV